MSPRKNVWNEIVEAEVNPASSRWPDRFPVDGMEWTSMNYDDAHVSLLALIGEMLYKNQLLREAIASKVEVIELIINHLMSAATSPCSCGIANELTFVRNVVKERDAELARRKGYCFNKSCNCNIVEQRIDSAANVPWDVAIEAAEN